MKKISFFYILIASGFGSGFSPVAPGTAGALLATVVWLILSCFISYPVLWILTVSMILLFTWLGIVSANALEKAWGKDPSRIVVDEMVGVWIALLAVPEGNLLYVVAAFVLFRFFDILKPLGIRKMECLSGGLGVMMDDILAGIYSLVLLALTRWGIG